MLRIGLTGGLGSGKSTAAALLAERGAHLLSSDGIGRELMQPGQTVYQQIVDRFGEAVVLPSGELDRPALARLAFAEGRLEELNSIVHPAVITREAELSATFARDDPSGIVVTESALLLETPHAGPGGWRSRFDRLVLVTAPEPVRIARFIERTLGPGPHSEEQLQATAADARQRLARQLPDSAKRPHADFILDNAGSLLELRHAVGDLWADLLALSTHYNQT